MRRAIFHSDNLNTDYLLFEKAVFKPSKAQYPLTKELKTQLRKYYTSTYVIGLYNLKLKDKFACEPNKFLFVSEILSDLLSNSSISLLGFYSSSKILTRRLIENFYNHIYYFSHPVEYDLLNSGRNEYTPINDLKKYYFSHPIISCQLEKDENIKSYNESLFNHYHELCMHVHTKGQEFMELATTLSEIKPVIDIVKHFEYANKCVLEIIYLLYKFHTDVNFSNVEKAIIAKLYAKDIRRSLFA